MAKSIASLQAVVGAQIAGLEAGMKRAESSVKHSAGVIDNTKATMHVQADTKTANAKLQGLQKTPATVRVQANTKPAEAKISALQKQIMNKPLTLGMGIASAALMRAVTQTEEGKELLANIDHVTNSVLTPLIKAIMPLVEGLIPMGEALGQTFTVMTDTVQSWIDQLPKIGIGGDGEADNSLAINLGIAGLLARFISPHAGWLALGYAIGDQVGKVIRGTTPPGAPTAAAIAPGPGGTGLAATVYAMGFPTAVTNAAAGTVQQFAQMQAAMAAQLAGQSPLQQQIAQLNTQFTAQMNAAIAQKDQQIAALQAKLPGASPAEAAAIQAQIQTIQTGFTSIGHKLTTELNLHIATLEKLEKQQKILEKNNKTMQMADSIIKSTQSPLQVFQATMDQLSQLVTAGALTQGQFDAAAAQAFATLSSAVGTQATQGVGFVQQGSAEAQAAINAFNRQGGQANIQEQINQVLKQALAQQTATAAHAAEIARALTRGGVATIAPGPRLPRP